VDGLVRKTFQKAQAQAASSACLVAVGGYGRSELAPCSDVDLLLLHPPSPQATLQRLIEQTLYPLWDLDWKSVAAQIHLGMSENGTVGLGRRRA
jgi:[protein-PII] uridylyltransferase